MAGDTVLVKQPHTIDLEYRSLKLEAGRTYYDDGTTVFDAYIHAGVERGWLEKVPRRRDTIVVTHRG